MIKLLIKLKVVAMLCFLLATGVMSDEDMKFGHGAEFFLKSDASSGGVKKPAVFAHPPWKDGVKAQVACKYDIYLNDASNPVLEFYIGLQDGHGSSDGVIYRIRIGDKEIWHKFCSESKWEPVKISLKEYAGKAMSVELSVESRGEYWANWGTPRVVDGDKVLYDLGAMTYKAEKYLLPPTDMVVKKKSDKSKAKARPTPEQLEWQQDGFIGFIHFGMNTFVGNTDWGDGTASPDSFNPDRMDAEQWVKELKNAGMKMLIITAKHHDGFCLWPSKYTDYSVKSSKWKNGKGDVIREVADACKKAGIKLGIYLSPWDRHSKIYGTDEYNIFFKNQLRELLTDYGKVSEVWFDGACGEGPNGKKQVYDWNAYYELIRELQPHALIAICGPDIRWVGNEDGLARFTEWSPQRKAGKYVWYPAECDVSIRPSWFYKESEDDKVKSPDQLLDIYFRSVGRNAVLLLNLPPDKHGLINENDVKALRGFRKKLDSMFAVNLISDAKISSENASSEHPASAIADNNPDTYWSVEDEQAEKVIKLSWEKEVSINIISLKEYIKEGQSVESFHIEYIDENGQWQPLSKATTIGACRLLKVPETKTKEIKIIIDSSLSAPKIQEVAVF